MSNPKSQPKSTNKGGRPRIELTAKQWKQIETACEIQCTAEEIAALMGFSVDTLERRIQEKHQLTFADYFKTYAPKGKASLRRWQFQAARKGNIGMLIWLGKQYLGQADKLPEEGDGKEDLAAAIIKLAQKLPGA